MLEEIFLVRKWGGEIRMFFFNIVIKLIRIVIFIVFLTGYGVLNLLLCILDYGSIIYWLIGGSSF